MLEVVHKGMKISWSDNEDAWSCMEMRFANPSLKRVKAKIDAFRRKERQGVKIPALYVETYSAPKAIPAEVVEHLGQKGRLDETRVAVMKPSGFKAKVSRSEEALSKFAADTPEARKAIEQAAALYDEGMELQRQARQIMKGIPRLTLDDIADLVNQAEYEND